MTYKAKSYPDDAAAARAYLLAKGRLPAGTDARLRRFSLNSKPYVAAFGPGAQSVDIPDGLLDSLPSAVVAAMEAGIETPFVAFVGRYPAPPKEEKE